MAEITEKKYLDLAGLTTYDGKIKAYAEAKDAVALQAAKDYADSLASNYDAKGTAATAAENALADAKAYAEEQDGILSQDIIVAQSTANDAAAAAAKAQEAADDAQSDVDALETYVGTIPTGDDGAAVAETVIEYINAKTDGVASDTALSELQGKVATAEAAIATIQGDYLVEADKQELQDSINTVSGKVTTLIGEDTGKSVRTIANEELAAQLIAEGAQESLDTLQEIAAWIQAHPDDASAMSKAIDDIEALVGTLPEGVEATTIVAYIQEVVAAEKTAREDADAALSGRVDDIEEALGTGTGSVTEQIATAKSEAIATAAEDATTKANQALADAKSYADGLNTAMDARVDALEDASHTHANAEVLGGITAEKVTAWDAALQASDIVTGTANGTIAVKGEDVAVKGLGSAAYTESSAYDASGAADAALASAKTYTDDQVAALQDSFVSITTTEINSLF